MPETLKQLREQMSRITDPDSYLEFGDQLNGIFKEFVCNAPKAGVTTDLAEAIITSPDRRVLEQPDLDAMPAPRRA